MVSCRRREGGRDASAFGGHAMNLRQLEIFGAVMSTGTTVGAAHLLHISQPAVSNTIHHMEAQLKFPLFHRNRGRLHPTDEAKLLYERTQKVFEAFDSAQFIVDQLRGGLIGDLRVVCTPSLGSTLVPLSVARFRANRPQVKVSIEVGSLDFVFESIEREKADVGVFFLPREHQIVTSASVIHLRARPLGAIPQIFMNDPRAVTMSLDDHEVIKAHGRPIVYGGELHGD